MDNPKYRFATRLNSFRTGGGRRISVLDAIAQIARVPGMSALELNYPQHFVADGTETVIRAARDSGLPITTLNLRYDGADFDAGAFTHPDGESREKAIENSIEAVDVAAANGIEHVILWMGPDGFDYPFQADYRALWDLEIDGFRRVADRDRGVKVSVEYKPSDPRRTSLIRSMGDSLLAVRDVGCDNFGVTLDMCHVLMAGEQPAAVAAQALRAGKLFGVHLNDGYGPADDGLMVGSVHLWQTLELLYELRKGGYPGTIYFDTFPERVDPAAESAANIEMVQRLEGLIDTIPADELAHIQSRQDAMAATRLVRDLMFGT